MSHTVTRRKPTFRQRAAMMLATQVLTLLGLAAWTVGSPWSAQENTAQAITRPSALVVTVGNGYLVENRDWQPSR